MCVLSIFCEFFLSRDMQVGCAKFSVSVNKCMYACMLSCDGLGWILSPCAHCLWDWLHIHYDLCKDKVVTEAEWMNGPILYFIDWTHTASLINKQDSLMYHFYRVHAVQQILKIRILINKYTVKYFRWWTFNRLLPYLVTEQDVSFWVFFFFDKNNFWCQATFYF